MIVKMKKITLFCTPKQQKETLHKLQELEALHVEHIKNPGDNELDLAKQYEEKIKKAKHTLDSYYSDNTQNQNIENIIEVITNLNNEIEQLEEQEKILEDEIKRIRIFGNFNPNDILKLRDNHIFIKLYRVSKKEEVELYPNIKIININSDKSDNYILAISTDNFSLPFNEILLPKNSLTSIQKELLSIQKSIKIHQTELKTLSNNKDNLNRLHANAIDNLAYEETRSGMGFTDNIVFIQGYIPSDKEKEIHNTAKTYGWGYVIRDVDDNDKTPTLLRNPKWINPIKSIFNLIAVVPGYKELDVSAVFLIFLSIFFAFIIGDAGYGLLFLIATVIAKIKLKKKVATQTALTLLIIMSTCTVIFGVLTGNYFGIPLLNMPQGLQSLSNPFMTGGANHIMFICFSIGLIHLSIARIWNFIRRINSPASFIDLGWFFCTCSLFIFVLELVINPTWLWFLAISSYKLIPLALGSILVLIGLILTKAYIGIVTLFLDIISNFVDIISYIRLYAVGTASLEIALAFNKIALGPNLDNSISIGAVLILFAGHALNIILAVMGVMVHGIRLNTLEFSGHAGIEWAGIHYKPFCKTFKN